MQGLLSFPLTPFTARDHGGTVHEAAFVEHLERQIAAGPSAIFVGCGTGEYSSLTPAEQERVIHVAVRVAAGRLPVYAGAGGGAGSARAAVRAAADAGADGVLLLPPYLVSGGSDGLLDHVRFAVRDSPIPAIVYQRATALFTPRTAVELLEIKEIRGLKDGVGDVDLMQRIVSAIRSSEHPRAQGFGFFNGLPTAELSQPAYRAIGVPAYSSAVHCFAPEITHAFARALDSGDVATIQLLTTAFFSPLAALRDSHPGYAVSIVKAGARLAGLDAGPVRPPLVDLSEGHLEQLRRILADGRRALAQIRAH
ncbi:putative 5-dehydro-4-deoxyglucarate dehydratase [Longispora fulva]|uniref:5-dehydro-4-deoxyglucarate dehydratase n=1 Tax=Longispora fulva TaxID=619741 RepID=A0A8J7G6K3_9ACTN|nr:5-dehydro-4-deoxyglucarate dehydratase [Longispora fulva]MBG6133850.1 5-dehydro-4-deoxyglucarate dehydratase [Longispora fulva]GIG62890.1 putative 5-dehydro-4-deoxyglucarate dehydratase [Longispora fulva]